MKLNRLTLFLPLAAPVIFALGFTKCDNGSLPGTTCEGLSAEQCCASLPDEAACKAVATCEPIYKEVFPGIGRHPTKPVYAGCQVKTSGCDGLEETACLANNSCEAIYEPVTYCKEGYLCAPKYSGCRNKTVSFGCSENKDCSPGQHCQRSGDCKRPPECDENPDTVCTWDCVEPIGICVPDEYGCQKDDECASGEHCVKQDDHCLPPPGCKAGDICPAVCFYKGVCEPIVSETLCQNDSDCGTGEACNFDDSCRPSPECVENGNLCDLCFGVCKPASCGNQCGTVDGVTNSLTHFGAFFDVTGAPRGITFLADGTFHYKENACLPGQYCIREGDVYKGRWKLYGREPVVSLSYSCNAPKTAPTELWYGDCNDAMTLSDQVNKATFSHIAIK